MSIRILYREIETLSFDQAIELAEELLDGIEDDPEYERLMREEIERRYREYKEGRVECLPIEEVIAELRAESEARMHKDLPEEPLIPRLFEEIKQEALQLPDDADRDDLAWAIFRHLEDRGFEVDWDTEAPFGRSRRPRLVSHEPR
jgi:putative addiction module component (TIGR02574 family)